MRRRWFWFCGNLRNPGHSTVRGGGFSLIEVLVTISIIVVLMSLLLVALRAVRAQAVMSESMSNLRQIGTWMSLYSGDYRDAVLPSEFQYNTNAYFGKVRKQATLGYPHHGTWTDIIWTHFELGAFPGAIPNGLSHDYRFDSPDKALYDVMNREIENPLRSKANNTRNMTATSGLSFDSSTPMPVALPFGTGAREQGYPGFFAANQWFDSRANRYRSNGEIALPSRSMYLIDSFAGEVIGERNSDDGTCAAFNFVPTGTGGGPFGSGGSPTATGQVDFRYVGETCLILFMDGHAEPIGRFEKLKELEEKRRVRVRMLESTVPPPPCP
jgi:prepilin-type N-terminal cleavage/methylation domain-containing protein